LTPSPPLNKGFCREKVTAFSGFDFWRRRLAGDIKRRFQGCVASISAIEFALFDQVSGSIP
jgi:hypothetical protein